MARTQTAVEEPINPHLEFAMKQREFSTEHPDFFIQVEACVAEVEAEGETYLKIEIQGMDAKYLPFVAKYLRKTPRRYLVRTFDGIRDNREPMAIELFWNRG